ncbi:MAG: TonB-dependent receptor, partial [Opitutaceae bacterium]|nr:TonB-dependent receptor [Opitutaceae bacterium]
TGILAANDASSAIDSIWDILNEPDSSPRRSGGGYGSARNTRDYEARGIEMDLTYNPLRNWRISLSAAYNDTTYLKVAPALDTYLEKYIDDVWRLHGGEGSGGNTINDIIDNRLLPNHRELKSMEGDTAAFIRPLSVTFVTKYRFTNPRWLRGVSVGGSVRYRDRTITGFGINEDGTINRDVTYHGRDIWQTNAFIAYERSFLRRKVRWKTQLSVRNILDDTKPLEVRARADGVPDRLQLVQPRTLTWSNSFSF